MKPTHIRQIYLSTYWEQRNNGPLWVTGCIFILSVALAIVPFFFQAGRESPWPLALLIFTGINCGNLLFWWSYFIFNTMQQCSPRNVKLAPGLLAAVMRAFFCAWLAAALVFSFLFSIGQGHFVLFFLGIGIALLWLTVMWAWGSWLIGTPLYFTGFWVPYVKKFAIASGLWENAPLSSALAVAALLALTVAFTKSIFGVQGDRAFALQARLSKRKAAMRGGTRLQQAGNGWERFLAPQWMYDLSLKRALHVKPGSPRDSLASLLRFAFCFGMHWSVFVSPFFSILFFLIVFHLLAIVFPQMSAITVSMDFSMASLPLLFLPSMAAGALLNNLYQTRREQALLRLLPGLPTGSGFNRTFLRMCLLQFAAAWALGLIVAVFMYVLLIHEGSKQAALASAFNLCGGLAALSIASYLPRNYASMKKPIANSVHVMLLPTLFAAMLLSLYYFLPSYIFWTIAAILIVTNAVRLRARWTIAVRGPVAVPVGWME